MGKTREGTTTTTNTIVGRTSSVRARFRPLVTGPCARSMMLEGTHCLAAFCAHQHPAARVPQSALCAESRVLLHTRNATLALRRHEAGAGEHGGRASTGDGGRGGMRAQSARPCAPQDDYTFGAVYQYVVNVPRHGVVTSSVLRRHRCCDVIMFGSARFLRARSHQWSVRLRSREC